MKKILPICFAVCLLFSITVLRETGATRVILGDIIAVSEHGQKRYIHLQDQGFELSPDAPAFDSILELAVPFEARIVIEADDDGQDHAIDIQPRYQ
jgi:hypothetical protein